MITPPRPARLLVAVLAMLAALGLAASVATAAVPGTLRLPGNGPAPGLSNPDLTLNLPGGGTQTSAAGLLGVEFTPSGGATAGHTALCLDLAGVITPTPVATTLLVQGEAGFALEGAGEVGWILASRDRLLAQAPDQNVEAAAMQVAVWQLTGQVADGPSPTDNAQVNARAAAVRAQAAGRSITTPALATGAPAACAGSPVSVTVSGTPGTAVRVSTSAGTLAGPGGSGPALDLVLPDSGTAALTLSSPAAGTATVTADFAAGGLARTRKDPGARDPQDVAWVVPGTLQATVAFTPCGSPPAQTTGTPGTPVTPATPGTTPTGRGTSPRRARSPSPRLTVTKSGPARARAGAVVRYAVTVRNTGRAAARGVVLTDLMPGQMTLVRRTRGMALVRGAMRWSLGTIRPGASRTVRYALRVGQAASGRRCNRAVARRPGTRPTGDTVCTTVIPAPRRVQPAVTG